MNFPFIGFTPDKGEPMLNSVMGSDLYGDLCSAKNKQLFVQVNAQGTAPFQGAVFGVPKEMLSLVTVFVNQDYPFQVSVGLVLKIKSNRKFFTTRVPKVIK